MSTIKASTLEIELARRQVMRNFKSIKKAIQDFLEEAEMSKGYSKSQAIEAFKCIDHELEKQAGQWIFDVQDYDYWDNI